MKNLRANIAQKNDFRFSVSNFRRPRVLKKFIVASVSLAETN